MQGKKCSILSCVNSNFDVDEISTGSKYDFRSTQNWMDNLPNELKKIPVINLSIPGRHIF